ncbi:MAG: hypothetical protein LUC34_00150 [Campylobacter sp.]|nr:hypothetical protein [Campylobacter sp.]
MSQKDQVLLALRKLGGAAGLSRLYAATDVSSWQTKTPFATIRRIVQTNGEFFKIQPGLWGLNEKKTEILKELGVKDEKNIAQSDFSHSYYQGLIADIGNLRNFTTYIPPQDKNRNCFIDKKLGEIANLSQIYDFTYPQILKFAKTIDVIWFNERKIPHSFFEVEHSTDFKNSLNKFYELQDFGAKFFIIADTARKRRFESVLSASIYKPIAANVKFVDYEAVANLYEKECVRSNSAI